MAANASDSKRNSSPAPARRQWVRPAVTDLPRLTELTLATGPGIPGSGGTGGGGSTVIIPPSP